MLEAIAAGVYEFDKVARALPRTGKLVAIDWGSKKIGIAVSDDEQFIATPRRVIVRSNFNKDSNEIAAICNDSTEMAVGIILGIPLTLSGQAGGEAAAKIKSIAHRLVAPCNLPILLWDERFSTQAAEHTLIEAGLSRKKRAKVIDRAAATFFLQSALDRLSYLRG